MRRLRDQAARVAAPARQDPHLLPQGSHMTNSDATVLIVDDNEHNRYTLTRRLNREGYLNLTTADNGRQALKALNAGRFDLVLLDVMMPKMNGYQVLEHLKGDLQLRDVPVIMISAL